MAKNGKVKKIKSFFFASCVVIFTHLKRGFYYILALTTFVEILLDFYLENPVFMRSEVCATIWYKPPVF